jgi:hypothetical protein
MLSRDQLLRRMETSNRRSRTIAWIAHDHEWCFAMNDRLRPTI